MLTQLLWQICYSTIKLCSGSLQGHLGPQQLLNQGKAFKISVQNVISIHVWTSNTAAVCVIDKAGPEACTSAMTAFCYD